MRRVRAAVISCLLAGGPCAAIGDVQQPPAPPATAAPPSPATPVATPPASATAVAAPVPDAVVPATAAITALPPTQYLGTVAGDELLDLLKADARFAALDKELVGSPIQLRVTHSFEATAGGKAAGFASAILAGGTLGLLPLVTNSDLVIIYELVVNGTPVTTYTYRRNFTRSQNIYSTDTTYGLGADGLAWARSTVGEFLAATGKDDKLATLLEEYQFYFGKPRP